MSLPVFSFATRISSSKIVDESGNEIVIPIHKSENDSEQATSMNIVTFCNPVSVSPPKQWVISLYKGTLTKMTFLQTKVGVLQLLNPDQHGLIQILGKRSGLEHGFSKEAHCNEIGYPWVNKWFPTNSPLDDFEGISLLPGCSSYIFIRMDNDNTLDAGDHEVVLCTVVGTGVWDSDHRRIKIRNADESPEEPRDQDSILYTGRLRSLGII